MECNGVFQNKSCFEAFENKTSKVFHFIYIAWLKKTIVGPRENFIQVCPFVLDKVDLSTNFSLGILRKVQHCFHRSKAVWNMNWFRGRCQSARWEWKWTTSLNRNVMVERKPRRDNQDLASCRGKKETWRKRMTKLLLKRHVIGKNMLLLRLSTPKDVTEGKSMYAALYPKNSVAGALGRLSSKAKFDRKLAHKNQHSFCAWSRVSFIYRKGLKTTENVLVRFETWSTQKRRPVQPIWCRMDQA